MTEAPLVVAGAGLAATLARDLAATGSGVTLLLPDDDTAARVKGLAGLTVTTDHRALTRAGLILDTGEGGFDLPAETPVLVAGHDPDPETFPDPHRFAGLQLLWPWPDARLAEILPSRGTSPEVLSAALSIADRLGRDTITGRPGQRAIGTRLLAALTQAADVVLFDGSTPWEVDEALVAAGFPIGPFEGEDLIGLDLTRARPPAPGLRPIPIAARMRDLGKLGRKTGAGWYRYPGGGGKVDDPIVADLALEEAYFAGAPRTDYTASQIAERLVMALVAEAVRLLDAGESADAIDRVAVGALGFPAAQGGLLAHADRLGAAQVVARLTALIPEDPGTWGIADSLAEAARTGGKLTAAR